MPRLLGVDIPNNKRVEYALRYIYGIGPTRAKIICQACGIADSMRASELNEEMINKIKNLDDGSIIVTSAIFQESKSSIIKTQASRKIYDYITKNLSPIGQFHKFRVYIK